MTDLVFHQTKHTDAASPRNNENLFTAITRSDSSICAHIIYTSCAEGFVHKHRELTYSKSVIILGV